MIKVCVDPGHGGNDRSNRGPTGYIEADGALKISLLLERELLSTGAFEVKLTRRKDDTLGLSERGRIAANWGADLFISQHTNAYDGKVRGTEVFYSIDIPEDKTFAADMSKAISSALGIPNRGAKFRESQTFPGEDYYTVIDTAQDLGVPHVLLIESAFHDNPKDEKLLKEEACLLKISKAQASVICRKFGVTYPPINELKQAAEHISSKIPGGIDVNLWSGSDIATKAKYIDTLILKIAKAWR